MTEPHALTLAEIEALYHEATEPRPRAPDGSMILTDEEYDALEQHGIIIIQDGQQHHILMNQRFYDAIQERNTAP